MSVGRLMAVALLAFAGAVACLGVVVTSGCSGGQAPTAAYVATDVSCDVWITIALGDGGTCEARYERARAFVDASPQCAPSLPPKSPCVARDAGADR